MLRATAQASGDRVAKLRRQLRQTIDEIKPQIAVIESALTTTATSTVALTDNYMCENPWTAMGFSAGAGLVIGLLMSRG